MSIKHRTSAHKWDNIYFTDCQVSHIICYIERRPGEQISSAIQGLAKLSGHPMPYIAILKARGEAFDTKISSFSEDEEASDEVIISE